MAGGYSDGACEYCLLRGHSTDDPRSYRRISGSALPRPNRHTAVYRAICHGCQCESQPVHRHGRRCHFCRGMKTGWLFDQIQELFAHAHGLTTGDVPYPLRSLIEREYERLDPRKNPDIGCRSSRYGLPGYDYLGIDPNSDHVTYCRRKRAGRFEEMSAGHLDVADKTFDVVLCLSVAHHLPNDSLRRVCSEIKRVLRNDGVLIS